MDYKKQISEFCKSIGLDLIGFTECRVFSELKPMLEERKAAGHQNEFEEDDIEKRINPFLYMPLGKTIISIAFPYKFESPCSGSPGFSVYTWGKDYHKVVSDYLRRVAEFIRGLGGEAQSFVDSNHLPERYIASLCGIGFIGKNNMLITEKYGSFVFLGEIITDLEIFDHIEKEDWSSRLKAIGKYEKCGECSNCLKACPTKAINESARNSNICLSYITQKKHIEDKWLGLMQGRLFGCDSCQLSCPYNQKAQHSGLEEFEPHEFMKEADSEQLIYLDNKTFKEKYINTSCGWRGKSVIQRNAMIDYYNKGGKIDPDKINSPYLKDYYDRLLKLFKL